MEVELELRDYLESQKTFWTLIVKDYGDLQNFTRAFCIMMWPQAMGAREQSWWFE